MANVSTTSEAPAKVDIPQPDMSPSLDLATLLGVTGAFVVIATAMVLGGSPDSFVDLPALLIVIFGTFLVTTVSYSLGEVARAQQIMVRAVVYHAEDPRSAAEQVLFLADHARKKGKLSLDQLLRSLSGNDFLFRATCQVVDGVPSHEIERVMLSDADSIHQRHLKSAGILRRAGEVAPAMGLIGTLVGLVQMLGNLQDPDAIGPSMAVALLTTFYGAVLANMVFTPLATKLERNSEIELTVNRIYATGAASISRQDNPRRLETVLNTMLPPAERLEYFD